MITVFLLSLKHLHTLSNSVANRTEISVYAEIIVVLPSSVMVPLLEPPLLLERGWEEAEDRESTGPVGGLGVGEGDGVRVGDVLLEVEEFPD